MKKLLLFLFIIISFSANCQVQQAYVPEPNPHRGIYVNRFFSIDPISWNNGAPFRVDPQSSMLGTDVNHDGIFEKEDAFLGYCRDNHITLILLLDLRYLIGRNVMIWDENRGREIDAEEHLCRFMNKAREEFCIDQIAATAGSENGFNRVFDFQQNFLHPTPPIIIPLAERTSSLFDSTLLIIEDSNLVQGTPEYYNAEELKFYYRATHFGDIQPNERRLCHSYFNYLNIEYEFWRSTLDGFMPAGTTIDPTCNDYCCTEVFSEDAGCSNPPGSPCSNGTAFPRGEDARFFLHFLPTLRAMRSLADNYNTLHGFAETDNEYMRTQAYTDPYYRIGNTFMQDYASLLDGSGGIPPTGTTCIGGNAFPRLLDRICPYSYHRYPYANIDAGLDGDWQWLLEHLNGAQLPYGTTDNNTDIHTIFSAEKISNYSYDNYWGPWFDETSSQNIFEAEKIYYRKWYLERYTWIPVMSEPRENAIHPGGIIWYTQSQMNGVLDNPKIFIADDPGCTSGNADINFQYIGPCEAGIQIEFRILRSGLNVWPTTGWNVTSTFTPALGVWNPTDVTTPNAAPDITALAIPSLMNDYSDPYTVQMRLTYAGGCSYLYEEDLFLNSGPAITAIGQSEFCEGGSVELHAPTGNSYRWMKDGNTISGATSQNYLATTSGLYSCEITGGSCSGVSGNSIPVTVHPNPYVDILIDCSVSPAILYVGPVLNTTPSSIGPGGVTYLWNTGSTLDQITTSIDGGYFLTVTTPTGCTREIRRNYDSDGDNPVLSLGFYRPPSADCSSDGSQEIIINSPGGVVHASYTDGIGTYWLNWTAGLQHTISNLSAGHYTVFVSVQGTCVESLSFDIGIPPTLTFNALPTDPSCHNGVNGTIELSISGAIGLYRIQVPTILFDEYHSLPYTIPGFSAGNYFIRISDGSCNWGTQMVSVGNPLSMNLTMSSSDATGCFNSETGSASVSVAGGSSPYQYLWNTIPAQTSLSIANLGFGTYEVRVTDNNGCTSTASTQVSSPNDIILDPIQPSNLTSDCGCTGLATFFVDGDFPPFSVSAPWVLSGSNATLSNACPGQYTIIVTDDNNCTTEDQVTITGTGSAINLQTTQQDVTCFGMQDGEGSVSVTSGGTGTFTYLWDDPNATTTATISGLAAGIYNVTVTDASGCVATGSITISQPASALIASSTQGTSIACNGGSTTVTVSATGGTAPYSGTGTFTVAAGTYSYTVTDDNGCSLTTSITVNEPSALAASSSATTILCNGGSSTVTVTATGGTAPYTGTGSFTVTAGTYTYPVSDANGCSTSTTITVSEPTLLVASATVIQLGCTGGYSTVQVTASGGTGSYTGVGNFSVLAGTYPYTVSDGNGCQSPTSVTVTDDINCCYVPSGEIVGSQVTIIPSGYYFGIKSLDHDVEIHSNVHFANLDLTISSSRKITVQSTGVLTISTNSYLHACANMWNGIINNGGTIIIQDSRIEDALEAVLMNKGNLQLDNGTFDHNFIGIHFLTGAYDQSTTWIRSSTFDCTTGQISKLPHVGELTSSHIVVENVSGLVMGTGIGQGFLNNIRNAKIGLNIVSSDIEVYNNNFEVLPYTFNYPIKCTAISASGTSGNFLQSIRIGSPAVPNNNSISNWRIGISANKIIGLNIDNNSISSNYAGIYVARCSNLKINNNMIRQFRTGVHCYDNSGNIEINNNYFNYPITPDVIKNTAIRVENPSSNSIDLRIESNWIFNATTGILCRNVPKAIVGKRNRIYFFADNSTLTTLGFNEAISLENCNDSYVLLNEVYRYIDPDPSMPEIMRGISIDKTTNAYVYGNNLRKMGQGIKFGGQCDYTQLHCNVMLDNFNGVFLDNSSQSDQGVPTESWDNYWNNQVDPSWYRVWGDNPLNGINWYYDASIDNNYNPNPHIANFINDIDLTPHGSCPDPTLVQISNNIEEDLKDIAYDLIQYSDFNGEMKYENKEFFYEKIKENPSLLNRGLPEDQVFQQLYNSLRTGNIGAFDDVKDFVKNSDFAQAYLKNLTIVHQNTIEENKKIVNEIYLHCEMNDTLPDSLQISLLENIAFQYPSSGGEAVYWARAILHLDIEDNMISLRKRNPIVKGEEGFGKLYPNPASETVIYEYPLKQEEKGVFEIYDQLNKMIFASEILTTYHSIKTSGFKNGVYNCRFIIDGKIVDYQKLVIVK